MELSPSVTPRIWRALALQARDKKALPPFREPRSLERLWDVAGLHVDPPGCAGKRLVLGKQQDQPAARTLPLLPTGVARAERRTHD
jgi:hypothetical protein